MHPDAVLALRAFESGQETWVRFTPDVVADLGDERQRLLDAVAEFESLDNEAGRAATEWLVGEALDNHGSTVTWLLIVNRRVEAYYALSSASVRLSNRDRKRLMEGSDTDYHALSPIQPASLVAWIAKRPDTTAPGGHVLMHALTTALDAAEFQGSIALVLDPFDEATSEMWLKQKRIPFRRAERDREDGRPRRLWAPLRPPLRNLG